MPRARSLHRIVEKDDWSLDEIKTFLKKYPSAINELNELGHTPLLRLLCNRNCTVDAVRLLVKCGADINYKHKRGESNLTTAIQRRGDEDIIRVLVENGADVNVCSGLGGQTALCYALNSGVSKGIIELLLDKGGLPNACSVHSTILHCAVRLPDPGPNEDVFHMLFERGFDVKAVDKWKLTVLCSALGSENKASTIRLLLEAGASFSDCSEHLSPLICATRDVLWGVLVKAEVIELILKSGVPTNEDYIEDCLYNIFDNCRYETDAIRLLLERLEGKNLNSIESDLHYNNSILHMAVKTPCCRPSVVELILKHGLQVNKVNEKGQTALHLAAELRECRPSVIRALLTNGSEINRTDSSGQTPLSIALENRVHPSNLKVLLASGALVRTHHGDSLLKSASGWWYVINKNFKFPRNSRSYRTMKHVEERLDCFKILLRYFFLETSDFNVDYMFEHHNHSRALWRFRDGCKRELQSMKSKYVGEDLTLHEFLSQYASSEFNLLMNLTSCRVQEKKYDFDQLLKTLADNAYPLYFGVIAAKVGRSLLIKKLQELHIKHIVKYFFDTPVTLKKRILNYKSLCSVINYLEDDDLLKWILAYYDVNDRPCTGQSCKKKSKKSAKLTELCSKRPKFH